MAIEFVGISFDFPVVQKHSDGTRIIIRRLMSSLRVSVISQFSDGDFADDFSVLDFRFSNTDCVNYEGGGVREEYEGNS